MSQAHSDQPIAATPSDFSPTRAFGGGTDPNAGAGPSAPPPVGAVAKDPSSKGMDFTLTAINHSTLNGNRYFSVFPPEMTVAPVQPQTILPLVSSATVKDGGQKTVATLTWPIGLTFFAIAPGQAADTVARTPVTLGSTVAVEWQNSAFTARLSPTGVESGVTVTLAADIPPASSVGLILGPGTILVPAPPGGKVVLTPNPKPVATVYFGTPWTSKNRNVSQPVKVTCAAIAATIVAGPDNIVRQFDPSPP